MDNLTNLESLQQLPKQTRRSESLLLALLACAASGCATSHDRTITQGPLAVAPLPRVTNVERINSGSIFQANNTGGYLFSTDKRPRNIGDTMKVEISETLTASTSVNTNTSRDSKLASKGPGGKSGNGPLASLINLDATASGSSTYKGDGSTEAASKFSGQLAVSVINVLPNGNLLVAGDKSIAVNGDLKTLRFSAIVDPKDIRVGNLVASSDTVNARMEIVGKGDVSDAASRSWLQRILAESLSVW